MKNIEEFKKCEDLESYYHLNLSDFNKYFVTRDVMISKKDIMHALKKYINGDISLKSLLFWTNTVWFSDVFDYDHEEAEEISDIMYQVEQFDEMRPEKVLPKAKNLYQKYS